METAGDLAGLARLPYVWQLEFECRHVLGAARSLGGSEQNLDLQQSSRHGGRHVARSGRALPRLGSFRNQKNSRSLRTKPGEHFAVCPFGAKPCPVESRQCQKQRPRGLPRFRGGCLWFASSRAENYILCTPHGTMGFQALHHNAGRGSPA